MPSTPNLAIPYPNASDNPSAPVLAALAKGLDTWASPWTSFTPTLSENGSAVAFTTLYSKYRQIGKVCYFKQKLDITGSGTAGAVVMALPPVAPKYTAQDNTIGTFYSINPSGSTPSLSQLVVVSGSTTTMKLPFGLSFNLTNSCFVWTWGKYEVA